MPPEAHAAQAAPMAQAAPATLVAQVAPAAQGAHAAALAAQPEAATLDIRHATMADLRNMHAEMKAEGRAVMQAEMRAEIMNMNKNNKLLQAQMGQTQLVVCADMRAEMQEAMQKMCTDVQAEMQAEIQDFRKIHAKMQAEMQDLHAQAKNLHTERQTASSTEAICGGEWAWQQEWQHVSASSCFLRHVCHPAWQEGHSALSRG